MLQVYFLSVAFTAIAGMVLSSDLLAEKFQSFEPLRDLMETKGFRLGTAGITGVVSLVTLLMMTPDSLPVLGDLLPGATGIFMTVTLIYEYLKNRDAEEGRSIDDPKMLPLIRYKALSGFLGIVVALVHFLFPGAIIL